MSDSETTNITAAGSGKSDPEVAFDLLNKLKGQGVWGERNLTPILDMYAECLDAVKGLRPYNGQNRVEAPILSPGARVNQAQNTAHNQAQARQPAPAQQVAALPPQSQPQVQAVQAQAVQAQPLQAQPAQAQPVQVQQQMLQQAFKQG